MTLPSEEKRCRFIKRHRQQERNCQINIMRSVPEDAIGTPGTGYTAA